MAVPTTNGTTTSSTNGTTSTTNPLSRISASNIDGKAHNVRFRQKQLFALNASLLAHVTEIRDAITKDSGHTAAEAEIEFFLGLGCVKERYSELNLDKSLEEEYKPAKGKDFAERRTGAGIVWIRPSGFTLFYSVLSALSAAIASGNCVVVELENNLLSLTPILRALLRTTLDADTFAIVSSSDPPAPASFLANCTRVLQNTPEASTSIHTLASPAKSRVVAFVDRTANLGDAANAIVTARFSFRGRSPYAPDLVLVNEFVKKDFLAAVVRVAIRYLAEQNGGLIPSMEKKSTMNGSGKFSPSSQKGREQLRRWVEEAQMEEGAKVVVSGTNCTVVDIGSRTSALLHQKITDTLLLIHPVSSLDDAIDFANSLTKSTHLLATYIFASPRAAKYQSQFLSSSLSCINHIPLSLLVGPAAPPHPTATAALHLRYSTNMFSTPSPILVTPAASGPSLVLNAILRDSQFSEVQTLREEGTKPLRPIGQREGKAIGFFEQGIIVGGLCLLGLLSAGVLGLGWAGGGMVRGIRR